MRKRASRINSGENPTRRQKARAKRWEQKTLPRRKENKVHRREGGKNSGENPTQKGRDRALKGDGTRKNPTKNLIEKTADRGTDLAKDKLPVLEVHISEK